MNHFPYLFLLCLCLFTFAVFAVGCKGMARESAVTHLAQQSSGGLKESLTVINREATAIDGATKDAGIKAHVQTIKSEDAAAVEYVKPMDSAIAMNDTLQSEVSALQTDKASHNMDWFGPRTHRDVRYVVIAAVLLSIAFGLAKGALAAFPGQVEISAVYHVALAFVTSGLSTIHGVFSWVVGKILSRATNPATDTTAANPTTTTNYTGVYK